MSRKRIVGKNEGDAEVTKKNSPRKWAATKSVTSAEIVWQHVMGDEEARKGKETSGDEDRKTTSK